MLIVCIWSITIFISDEKSLMDTLPTKLRTDLAIHVHFNTLSRVKLFQDCDKSLLYNLVLKLKPILFLPGEYVCRKVWYSFPFIIMNVILLVRKDIDVNEQEKHYTRAKIKATKHHLHWCSECHSHSHSRVFNNEYNSYPKMRAKYM
jgi:hypothetical protein